MRALELKKKLQAGQYGKPIEERSEIESALSELCIQVMDPAYPDVLTLQKRILKHSDYILSFCMDMKFDVNGDKNFRLALDFPLEQQLVINKDKIDDFAKWLLEDHEK